MKPFRFGVLAFGAPTGNAWRERARMIEGLGYSTMFLPDHLMNQWSPLVGLTVAAEATTDLRVGSLVFNNDLRDPTILARELATLDLASGGRVECGFGAGWKHEDYAQLGKTIDRPGVRISRLAESVRIMKQLWADGNGCYTGQHYDVRSASGYPKPHTSPHPRVLIGGAGKRLLTLAAQEADIVGLAPSAASGTVDAQTAQSVKPERFDERLAWVKEAAGSRFSELELLGLATATCVVPNRRAAFEDSRTFDHPDMRSTALLVRHLSVEELEEVPLMLVGNVDEICETLEQRRDRYGFNYWVVPDSAIEAFAPVVARMAGK